MFAMRCMKKWRDWYALAPAVFVVCGILRTMVAAVALALTALIASAIIHAAAVAVCAVVAHNYWSNEQMAAESLDPSVITQNHDHRNR